MKERNVAIDFLRAVSMLLIVIQHYVVWGIKPSIHAVFHVNNIYTLCDYTLMEGLYLLSCIGVNCFIMITGYFLITEYRFRWNSLIKLWIITCFYSVALYLFSAFLEGGNFNLKEFAKCFAPIWSKQYWFISKYFALMLIAPFLSVLATQISKKSYQVMLVILFCLSFMVPYGKIYAGSTSIMWLSFVFLTAGYIRLHGVPDLIKANVRLLFGAILVIYTLSVLIGEIVLHTEFSTMDGSYELHSFASDSPIFFLSLAIFIWTTKSTPPNPQHISNVLFNNCVKIAPYILAVYLIHMNQYFYVFIWKYIIPETYHMPVALHAIITCSLVFVLCIFIDYIRDKIFKIACVDTIAKKISSYIKIKEIIIKT